MQIHARSLQIVSPYHVFHECGVVHRHKMRPDSQTTKTVDNARE